MTCSALPLTKPVNVNDKPWFQRAIQTGEFTIGEYQVSPITNKDILGFLYPITNGTGGIENVIFASLDLVWLSQHEIEILQQLSPGTTLTEIDRNGIILSRQPYPASFRWRGDDPHQPRGNHLH